MYDHLLHLLRLLQLLYLLQLPTTTWGHTSVPTGHGTGVSGHFMGSYMNILNSASRATIPLCFEFFRCRVDISQS